MVCMERYVSDGGFEPYGGARHCKDAGRMALRGGLASCGVSADMVSWAELLSAVVTLAEPSSNLCFFAEGMVGEVKSTGAHVGRFCDAEGAAAGAGGCGAALTVAGTGVGVSASSSSSDKSSIAETVLLYSLLVCCCCCPGSVLSTAG